MDEEEAFFALNDAEVVAKLAEQNEMLNGKEGALLWAVSIQNGEKLAEYKLESLPVWDGMVAANGRLYLTTLNGKVISYAGKGD